MNVRQLPHHAQRSVIPRPSLRKKPTRRSRTRSTLCVGRYDDPGDIGHNERVRRSFAGLFFGMAFTCACLAISGFVLQRTAFSPSNTESSAGVILGDSELELELVTLIAEAAAPSIPAGTFPGTPEAPSPALVAQYVADNVLNTDAGADLVAGFLRDAHAKLIGDTDENPTITAAQM